MAKTLFFYQNPIFNEFLTSCCMILLSYDTWSTILTFWQRESLFPHNVNTHKKKTASKFLSDNLFLCCWSGRFWDVGREFAFYEFDKWQKLEYMKATHLWSGNYWMEIIKHLNFIFFLSNRANHDSLNLFNAFDNAKTKHIWAYKFCRIHLKVMRHKTLH